MIIIKTKPEIEIMKDAGKIVRDALLKAEESIHAGMTTKELDMIIENCITSHGAKPSFKNYNGFPAASCISPNCVVVHGIPSEKTVLHEGDIVSVDIGAFFKGYHADAARTFPVGNISSEARRLIDVTKECFFKGAANALKGKRVGDIGFAVQTLAEGNGYGVVRELVGHGVGKELHESPDVPNYGRQGHGIRLAAGMVIAIEPMINEGRPEIDFDRSDGWTVRTRDRLLSAHYENTVVVTDGEPVFLTL